MSVLGPHLLDNLGKEPIAISRTTEGVQGIFGGISHLVGTCICNFGRLVLASLYENHASTISSLINHLTPSNV